MKIDHRVGRDKRYAIDATKADEDFDTGLLKTVEWYLNKYKGIKIEK